MKVAVASDKMNAFQPPTLPSLTDINDDGDVDDPDESNNGGVRSSFGSNHILCQTRCVSIIEDVVMLLLL